MPEDHTPSPLQNLETLADAGDGQGLAEYVGRLHPAEIARALESMPRDHRLEIWLAAAPRERGEVLLELHDEARDQLISGAPHDALSDAVAKLEADEIADLDAHLPPPVLDRVMSYVDPDRYLEFEQVRAFDDDSAGGLMDADAIRVRPEIDLATVQRYLRHLRRRRDKLPEHLDSVMVTTRDGRLVGTLSLADIISRHPSTLVRKVMSDDPVAIEHGTPATEVAHLFQDRDLVSAPVVDEDRHLLGRITIDDVVDVIREEADRMVLRPAGLDEDADLFAPAGQSVRRRAVWLTVNLVNAFIAAWVIGLFESSIAAVTALAVLMPVVASMGGVAGQQSLALVIRGLAVDQVNRANAVRLTAKEALVGLMNGAIFAGIAAAIGIAWFGNPTLGWVFGLAMIVNLLMGTVMGTALPMLLRAVGVDPALAGGVALTATTDVVGFFVFLGLATWLVI